MTRDDLIAATRQLVDDGDRLGADPSMGGLRVWLQRSDDLLSTAWGSMDRYHLAWLMVGKPKGIVRGRPMTADEEAAYVREVAEQKTAALRMSLDAIERQQMPFVGESGGFGAGGAGGAGGPGDPGIGGPGIGGPGAAGSRTGSWVPAVGGARTVPPPDPIARDYLLLALRLDQQIPGLVDGYFGPADLKAQVETEQLHSPANLREDAVAIRQRLPSEVAEPDRRVWLDAQLVALETQAAALAGERLPYLEYVARCFAYAPPRRPDAEFEAAAAGLDALLPGTASLTDRLEAWDAQFEIPADRLEAVVGWLVERFRARASSMFGLPEGEDLRVSFVTGQPWSGYNWFDGGRRSRVDINTDLPQRASALVHTVAHETYPGHHLEHAWKESDLVDAAERLESSILLINTPECLISEGLADLGMRFAVPPAEEAGLLVELYDRAGLAIARDPQAALVAAERTVALAKHRDAMGAIRGNAAILRHADGRSHDEVLDYLRQVGRASPARAAKSLEFIEHPLWRTYVFVYAEGEELLARWLDAVPEPQRVARFGRLLHEQLTPAAFRPPG